MLIYSIFIRDPEFGDELVESCTGEKAATKIATRLRRTFRHVEVRPTTLHVGYRAPVVLKRKECEQQHVRIVGETKSEAQAI